MLRKIDHTHEFSYSLVRRYEEWLNSERDYNRFYGNSENSPIPDEYELGKKLEFYSSLFKLQFKPEFERDDTSLILGKVFENALNNALSLSSNSEITVFEFINNKSESYNIVLNPDFITLVENRKTNPPKQQVEIKGILPNGLKFIGYSDEVYENCIIDIKTTSNFSKLNYDTSLQIPLYLHFINDYLIQRGFYQVTEFYRSKAIGKNEFLMKDTFMIECSHITESQLTVFSDLCMEILKNVSIFENDVEKYSNYFI